MIPAAQWAQRILEDMFWDSTVQRVTQAFTQASVLTQMQQGTLNCHLFVCSGPRENVSAPNAFLHFAPFH